MWKTLHVIWILSQLVPTQISLLITVIETTGCLWMAYTFKLATLDIVDSWFLIVYCQSPLPKNGIKSTFSIATLNIIAIDNKQSKITICNLAFLKVYAFQKQTVIDITVISNAMFCLNFSLSLKMQIMVIFEIAPVLKKLFIHGQSYKTFFSGAIQKY